MAASLYRNVRQTLNENKDKYACAAKLLERLDNLPKEGPELENFVNQYKLKGHGNLYPSKWKAIETQLQQESAASAPLNDEIEKLKSDLHNTRIELQTSQAKEQEWIEFYASRKRDWNAEKNNLIHARTTLQERFSRAESELFTANNTIANLRKQMQDQAFWWGRDNKAATDEEQRKRQRRSWNSW